jgi:hypothetical protein
MTLCRIIKIAWRKRELQPHSRKLVGGDYLEIAASEALRCLLPT